MDVEEIKDYITDLTSPQQAEFIQKYTKDLIVMRDLDNAKQFLDFLTEKLNSQGSAVEAKNPQLYDQYEKIWIQLAISAFVVLDKADQENLLQQRLLFAIQKGCSMDQWYKDYFDFFGRTPETQNAIKSFTKQLEENTETLGNAPLEVDGRKLLPQLKYWIMDYTRFPSTVPRRGSIERLNYLNKNPNTRILTQGQRQQLLDVLKLYDDLLNAEIPVKQRIPDFGVSSNNAEISAIKQQPERKENVTINIQDKLEELKQRTNR